MLLLPFAPERSSGSWERPSQGSGYVSIANIGWPAISIIRRLRRSRRGARQGQDTATPSRVRPLPHRTVESHDQSSGHDSEKLDRFVEPFQDGRANSFVANP
jgi:hypothetical protein